VRAGTLYAGNADAVPAGDRGDGEPDSASACAFARPTLTYQGLTYITNLSSPLFITSTPTPGSLSQPAGRPRQLLHNSITATQAHKLLFLSLASHFSIIGQPVGNHGVGPVTAYVVWGGPPAWGQLTVPSFPVRRRLHSVSVLRLHCGAAQHPERIPKFVAEVQLRGWRSIHFRLV